MGCRAKTPGLGNTLPGLVDMQVDPPAAPPHLPCFLFATALFCFANGFFIYFCGCRKLQGEKRRRNDENPVVAADDTSTDPASPLPRAAHPTCACCVVACVESCSSSSGTDSSLSDSVPDPKNTHPSLCGSGRPRGCSEISPMLLPEPCGCSETRSGTPSCRDAAPA